MIDPSIETKAAAWIAPSAELYGNVELCEGANIWPQAVLRAEDTVIRVGEYTNLQDFVMVHFGNDQGVGVPSIIGDYCSITHHATVHGAVIGNCCLVGINATIMDGVQIGDNCIVAGNSIIREGTVIPANSIVAGVPAKVVGQRNNYVANKLNAIAYHQNALGFAQGNYRRWSQDGYKQHMTQAQQTTEQEFVQSQQQQQQ